MLNVQSRVQCNVYQYSMCNVVQCNVHQCLMCKIKCNVAIANMATPKIIEVYDKCVKNITFSVEKNPATFLLFV